MHRCLSALIVALVIPVAISGCKKKTEPSARIEEQAKADEKRKADGDALAAKQSLLRSAVDTDRAALVKTLAGVETEIAGKIAPCKKNKAAGAGKRRYASIDRSLLGSPVANGTKKTAFTSGTLFQALRATDPAEARIALDSITQTQYLVVVQSTKNVSPTEAGPGKFVDGLYAGQGWLVDLPSKHTICQTSDQTTELGFVGTTFIQRGASAPPVAEQLNDQLALSLVRKLGSTFHASVADFGTVLLD